MQVPQPQTEARAILLALGALLRQLTRITGGPDESLAMTMTQRLALFELAHEGPLRLNDLAGRLGTTPPTASRAVDALVELGFVERLVDPVDRRALRIDVTPEGRARAEEREARVTAAFEPAIAALSPRERTSFTKLLARVTELLHD